MRRCVYLGFGSIAKTLFPLVPKYLPIKISETIVVDCIEVKEREFAGIPFKFIRVNLNAENTEREISKIVEDGDIVFDVTCCTGTGQIMAAVGAKRNCLYINSAIESWEEDWDDTQVELYDKMLKRMAAVDVKSTVMYDMGANPGLITHFARLALFGMARSAIERGVADKDKIKELLDQKNVPALATLLQVDALHVSEKEDMKPTNLEPYEGYTVNSWAVPGFHEEWTFDGEVIAGTKDREALSAEGYRKVDERVTTVPFPTHIHTANPDGIFTGRVVRHPEILELEAVFRDTNHVPTVAFVYQPSDIARKRMLLPNWENLPKKVMMEVDGGPLIGYESMGATLISSRDDIPARYYGSILSCEQSREVGCLVNPTTLQVGAAQMAHIIVSLKDPHIGVFQPHHFDSEEIMKVAAPLLGTVWDGDLPFDLPSGWNELLSSEKLEGDRP